MSKIKTALISVSDKKDLKPILDILKKNKVKIMIDKKIFIIKA